VRAVNRSRIAQDFLFNPHGVLERIRTHLYTPVFKDFLDYVGQNYQEEFGGGKIVFLGTGCKYFFQGMQKLAKKYGIALENIFLLDLPQQKLGARIRRDEEPTLPDDRKDFIYRLLKYQGIVKDGDSTPIAIFDDQLQGRVVYLLEQVLEERGIIAKGLGMVFCIGGQRLVRGFNDVFPDRQQEIRLASSLLDWYTRTVRPVEYVDQGDKIVIRYEAEPKMAFGKQMERLFNDLFDSGVRNG